MQLKDIPANVLNILKLRGHSEEAIEKMTPRRVFSEYGEWHGIPIPSSTSRSH